MKTRKKVDILLHTLFNLALRETIGKPFSIQWSSISERSVLLGGLPGIARLFLQQQHAGEDEQTQVE
jgi:hypothetical protein